MRITRFLCVCACVFVNMLHREDQHSHFTNNVRTLLGSVDFVAGAQNFKGLLRAQTWGLVRVVRPCLPNKAPTASPAVCGLEKAAIALKMSGAPLPRARNVTP